MKIPGMFYMIISFVPWIVYWVLCGTGNATGIVIALVIASLLTIPQIRRMDFNLMDLTSLLYFGTATISTFIFNLNVFVERSGFLGYFALFLMALVSVIIKQPFTFQASKRDYPEIYWKERSFIVINNLITGAWAGIFIANATIFLLLNRSFAVILSNTLIAFGIAFSIIFPLKAPAYLATKEFRKYDWKVDVKRSKRGKRIRCHNRWLRYWWTNLWCFAIKKRLQGFGFGTAFSGGRLLLFF